MVNEQYSATITIINPDGERGDDVTLEFGMCCTMYSNMIIMVVWCIQSPMIFSQLVEELYLVD